MITFARHAKTVSSFIEQTQQNDNLQERLKMVENDLSHKLHDHHSKYSTAPLFFELDLSPTELDWISYELGSALNSGKPNMSLGRLLKNYPRTMLAALVNAGTHITENRSFWPVFWNKLGYSGTSKDEELIRKQMPSLLKASRLEEFKNVELGPNKYVTIANLHAGIKTSDLHRIVKDSLRLLEVDDDPEDGDREGLLLAQQYAQQRKPWGLYCLATYKQNLAQVLFARIVEYIYYTCTTSDWFERTDFQGTNGLPRKTFEELKLFLHQAESKEDPSRGSDSALQNLIGLDTPPSIELNIDEGAIYVVLPEHGVLDDDDPLLQWHIDVGFDAFTVQSSFDWNRKVFNQRTVAITHPTSNLTITNLATHRTYEFKLKRPGHPFILFSRSGKWLKDQSSISISNCLVLTKTDTSIVNSTDRKTITPVADYLFDAWPGWAIYQLGNLSQYRSIDIRHSSGTVVGSRQIRVKAIGWPTWLDTTGTIPNLFGVDLQPVFHTSPQLVLPYDETAKWLIQISYLNLVGDREVTYEFEPEPSISYRPFKVFDSSFTDAWVGRYEVTVLRNQHVVDRRVFNMAEGLNINLKYEGKAGFRHPAQEVQRQNYTKVYFDATYSDKLINLPFLGNDAIPPSQKSKTFIIDNGEGYELSATVIPEVLKFQVPQLGVPKTWESYPTVYSLKNLDPNGYIRVRFPHKIDTAVKLYVVDKQSRRPSHIDLIAERSGKGFSISVSELLKQTQNLGKELILSLSWQPQSAEDYWNQSRDSLKLRSFRKSGGFQEFCREYENNRITNPCIATFANLSDLQFSGSLRLVGSIITIDGYALDKSKLIGYIWPLTQPNASPVLIEFDEMLSAPLPDSLINAGPLIIEVASHTTNFDQKPPEVPTQNARILSQPGYLPDNKSPLGLSFKLSDVSPVIPVLPAEQSQLWEVAHKIRHLAIRKGAESDSLRKIYDVLTCTISDNPRDALGTLGRSNIPVDQQPALAIRTGLLTEPFTTQGDTLNEFHPVPWVGILEEMSDISLLSQINHNFQRKEELQDSIDYVATTGGPDLVKMLGGTPVSDTGIFKKIIGDIDFALHFDDLDDHIADLADHDRSSSLTDPKVIAHGWSQLMRNRAEVPYIENFDRFLERILNHHMTNPSPEMAEKFQLLWAFGNSNTTAANNQWCWVPFLSFACAFHARAEAYKQPCHKLSRKDLECWASLAEIAPALIMNDILRADAALSTIAAKEPQLEQNHG